MRSKRIMATIVAVASMAFVAISGTPAGATTRTNANGWTSTRLNGSAFYGGEAKFTLAANQPKLKTDWPGHCEVAPPGQSCAPDSANAKQVIRAYDPGGSYVEAGFRVDNVTMAPGFGCTAWLVDLCLHYGETFHLGCVNGCWYWADFNPSLDSEPNVHVLYDNISSASVKTKKLTVTKNYYNGAQWIIYEYDASNQAVMVGVSESRMPSGYSTAIDIVQEESGVYWSGSGFALVTELNWQGSGWGWGAGWQSSWMTFAGAGVPAVTSVSYSGPFLYDIEEQL